LFTEGLAVVVNHDKYGYIDANGRGIIPIQFDEAAPFSEGLAAVRVGEKWGYIDKNGHWAIDPKFGTKLGGAGTFAEGLAPVSFQGQMGYVDYTGHFVIPPQFEFAEPFSEGLAAVGRVVQPNVSSLPVFGFIDRAGRVVVPLQYAGARPFREKLAVVSVYRAGVSFYPQAVIDQTGTSVIPLSQAGIGDFHEGRALFGRGANGKFGFIDKAGKQLIPPKFLSIDDTGPSEFSEGLAAVSFSNGRAGYIDRAGRIVIPARFRIACPFNGGIALVYSRNQVAYIDKSGKHVWSVSNNDIPKDDEPDCNW